MLLHCLPNFAFRIIEIAKHQRTGGANGYTGRFFPFLQPVFVTKRTFIGSTGNRINKPGLIRTRINTVLTANTLFFLDHVNALFIYIGGSGWTHRNTGSILTHYTRVPLKIHNKPGILTLGSINADLQAVDNFRNFILSPAGYRAGLTANTPIAVKKHAIAFICHKDDSSLYLSDFDPGSMK
jgi:hypothetical protein